MFNDCKYGTLGGIRFTLPCYYRRVIGIKKEQSTKS
uniref:Uncharacterized protein n=1 Tax=Siphoviridae sp. ctJER10 TaxID=2825430 RepID=A0A8S5PTZ6_9CAUD|nr:MAG TPA: hypothetical protein [Siphoviridae sp. ctJER10]DAY15249.1 MAG TPA: hypothetical protein [Caudoviricetes sp.]